MKTKSLIANIFIAVIVLLFSVGCGTFGKSIHEQHTERIVELREEYRYERQETNALRRVKELEQKISETKLEREKINQRYSEIY